MLFLCYVRHAADGTFSGLLASATFAVHGADIGGGVFLALSVSFHRHALSVIMIGVVVVGVVVIVLLGGVGRGLLAAAGGKSQRRAEQQRHSKFQYELFHSQLSQFIGKRMFRYIVAKQAAIGLGCIHRDMDGRLTVL